MTNYPTLRKAPIVEALVDIRIRPLADPNVVALDAIHDIIKSRYPQKQARHQAQHQWTVDTGAGTSRTVDMPPVPIGFMFVSDDSQKVLQALTTGFTFSKLKPYQSWSKFEPEAQELWSYYVDAMQPLEITRLALRYINRLDLPLPIADLKDYILTVPEIAPTLPQRMIQFSLQVLIPQPDSSAVANVILMVPPLEKPSETTVSLIFDLDVWQDVSISADSSRIWQILDSHRAFKNKLFFESLTEMALELFK